MAERKLAKKESVVRAVAGLTTDAGLRGQYEHNTRELGNAVVRLTMLQSIVTTKCEATDPVEAEKQAPSTFDGFVYEQRAAIAKLNQMIDSLGTHLLGDEWRNHHMPLQKERV